MLQEGEESSLFQEIMSERFSGSWEKKMKELRKTDRINKNYRNLARQGGITKEDLLEGVEGV